jgi:hypothetical protein
MKSGPITISGGGEKPYLGKRQGAPSAPTGDSMRGMSETPDSQEASETPGGIIDDKTAILGLVRKQL